MKCRKIFKQVLELDLKMAKADIVKSLENLQGQIREELKESNEENHEQYTKNLIEQRRKRAINNSRQAIKKAWSNRKAKKELILRHVKILRSPASIKVSKAEPVKRGKISMMFENDLKKIKKMREDGVSLERIVENLGYGTKQSLSEFLKKVLKLSGV